METHERQYVLDNLKSSDEHLRQVTSHLTSAQWHFHERPERWSIAQNVDHCILVENAILAGIHRALTKPKQTEKKAFAPAREEHVKGVGSSKGREILAPEGLCPAGDRTDTDAMLAELVKVRERTVEFASTTDAELRDHFFPHHVMGDLDCYQWLVIMSQHGERHAKQIEEIKRDPGYPQT